MQTRSSSLRSMGFWPSMPVSAVQNAISPGLRVDQPPVLVAGVVGQRGGDLVEVKAVGVKHWASMGSRSAWVLPAVATHPDGGDRWIRVRGWMIGVVATRQD